MDDLVREVYHDRPSEISRAEFACLPLGGGPMAHRAGRSDCRNMNKQHCEFLSNSRGSLRSRRWYPTYLKPGRTVTRTILRICDRRCSSFRGLLNYEQMICRFPRGAFRICRVWVNFPARGWDHPPRSSPAFRAIRSSSLTCSGLRYSWWSPCSRILRTLSLA